MLELTAGGQSLVVAPEHGGAIVGWTCDGTHLLRPPTPDSVLLGQPGAMGLFPLVPYCNRIAWCRFTWSGRAYALEANFGDHPHAIHGVGWQRAWSVEAVSAESVTLSLHHAATGKTARAWPFAFSATLTYRLSGRGLTIGIAATNRHTDAVPIGVGVHPYFPGRPGATIAFRAEGVWLNRDALPVTHGPIPAAWDHAGGRAADDERLDNCFTGWDRRALLPGMRISAGATFPELQVFTPPGADFFCVEPVSHVPNAINHPELPKDQAMTVLPPGETLAGSICLTLDG